MIGEYCLDCWLGECEQVLFAHVAPVSLVDCPCCRLGHDWSSADVGPLALAPFPSWARG